MNDTMLFRQLKKILDIAVVNGHSYFSDKEMLVIYSSVSPNAQFVFSLYRF